MPICLCSAFILSTPGLPCAHLYFPRCFSSLPTGKNQHSAAPRELSGGHFWGHFGDITSAAALEAQGAGEGPHGGVQSIPHGRGLAGGGVRLAAVAVGLAGLLVHPQGGQGELLPAGGTGTVRHSCPPVGTQLGVGGWGNRSTPYLFSLRPFPVSRKPLAKGLLSIFSCVI